MKNLIILCFIFCFIQVAFSSKASEAKIKQMIKKSGSVFEINTIGEYNEFIEERSYPVVLMFTTAKELTSQCPVCPQFKEMFQMVGQMYLKDANRKKPKAYFGVLNYKPTLQSVAARLKIQNIPMVLIFKGKSSPPQPCNLQSESIPQCLQRTLKIDLDLRQMPRGAPGAGGAPGGAGGAPPKRPVLPSEGTVVMLALFIAVVLGFLFFRSIRKRSILFVINLLLYIICVGGIVYTRINSPPSTTFTGRSWILFYPQQQQMLYAEGFIASTMMVIVALSILFISEVLPRFKMAFWIRRLLSCISVAIFFSSAITVVGFFILKNRWYMSGAQGVGNFIALYSNLLHSQ
mmetsp:Transcript_2567/g.3710  ORF Transcript_2567/g.3710 Transcript_2567/m.3710 type:complete len:347 (+) Transcript_2567:1497-2537(+)